MVDKQKVKKAIDLLTGKTAELLNQRFLLYAGAAEPGYAKLKFKSEETTYYEDPDEPVSTVVPRNALVLPSVVLIPEGADLKALGLPSQFLKLYKRAQYAKGDVESMGISDIGIGYDNSPLLSKNSGPFKRVYEFFILFPIDNKHKYNRLVARSMHRYDRKGVNYYDPVRQR